MEHKDKLPPIPTPVSQRWREFRIQILPFIIFVLVLGGIVALWRSFVQPVGIVGFAETNAVNVVAANGNEGAMHAHQIVLEVLSETGAIGLLLWIAGAVAAIRTWRRAHVAARRRALAPALALAVMCFPLNTHLAFYSASAWGLLFWWLIALYVAAIAPALVEHGSEP